MIPDPSLVCPPSVTQRDSKRGPLAGPLQGRPLDMSASAWHGVARSMPQSELPPACQGQE